MLQRLVESFDLDRYGLLGLYAYGSRVYGTADADSDHDFIAVVREPVGKIDNLSAGWADITIYDSQRFQEEIDAHEISVLECIFLGAEHVLITFPEATFNLDLPSLRRSISGKASNSFVKTKKKLTVPEDINVRIAKKSLFSSLRIINFGLQISRYGRIIDYGAANHYWREISENPSEDWETYKRLYQPVYNRTMSEFRRFAPKMAGE